MAKIIAMLKYDTSESLASNKNQNNAGDRVANRVDRECREPGVGSLFQPLQYLCNVVCVSI